MQLVRLQSAGSELTAGRAEARQLQPVVLHLKTGLAGNLLEERRQVIPAKIDYGSAGGTHHEMLVTLRGRQHAVAALIVVQALDQPQLLELLNRPVHSDQAQAGIAQAHRVENFHRIQRARAGEDGLDDRLAAIGAPVSAGLQLIQPFAG